MSDFLQPHRWQPTRLPRPWDSQGKNTGVGCHFFLQYMKVKSQSEVAQSCPTLSDLMDCSLPCSSQKKMGFSRQEYWSGVPSSSPIDPLQYFNNYFSHLNHVSCHNLKHSVSWIHNSLEDKQHSMFLWPYSSSFYLKCLSVNWPLKLCLSHSKSKSFPDCSVSKEFACNAGDTGSVPGLGRSPGVGNGRPLQYSCLINPMHRGAWHATVRSKSQIC